MNGKTADDLLREFTPVPEYEFVTHEIYCEALDLALEDSLTEEFFIHYIKQQIDEGVMDWIKGITLPGALLGFFKDIKEFVVKVGKDLAVSVQDIARAFKERSVFGVLKAFGFSIWKILKAIQQASALLSGGLLKVFQEIHKSGVAQKLHSGAMKIDEFLDKYPIIKKLSGPVIAGILLYIWLNMSFLGDTSFDLDISHIAAAVTGGFTLTKLFTSPEGMMMITLLATGMAGLSFPWLGGKIYNLTLALAYTGFKRLRDNAMVARLRTKMGV